MEKLAKYQAIVREVLEAEKIDRPDSDLRDVIISDPQSGHYQLFLQTMQRLRLEETSTGMETKNRPVQA